MCFFFIIRRKKITNIAVSHRGNRLKNLRSLLGGKDNETAQDSWIKTLGLSITGKVFSAVQVFNGGSTPLFIRNLMVPVVISLMLILVNKMYIGFPAHWIAIAVIPIAFMTCYAILNKRKRKQFNIDFSEALTTLSGAISSGRTFLQAMSDYATLSDNALSREFGIIGRRLNMGEDAEQVFYDSWKRFPYREYYFFIVAILLNIQGGGRLKEVLIKLQKAISTGIAMEKKMLAMTSEMRMAAKITGAIPFVFLILLKFISPENFEFVLFNESGKVILYYLLGSELIGMLIIKFLMRGM